MTAKSNGEDLPGGLQALTVECSQVMYGGGGEESTRHDRMGIILSKKKHFIFLQNKRDKKRAPIYNDSVCPLLDYH